MSHLSAAAAAGGGFAAGLAGSRYRPTADDNFVWTALSGAQSLTCV